MARAQILLMNEDETKLASLSQDNLLMNEDETKLASLSQDNLLMDIKVFPSSFSIKAALGNLKISDDSLPADHMYFWACNMRNPGAVHLLSWCLHPLVLTMKTIEGMSIASLDSFQKCALYV